MITSPAPHVLDTIMIMWMWRGGRGVGGRRRGRGGKLLMLGQTCKGDISQLPVPTPSFLSLYFLFRFFSGRYLCQILIWRRKSNQDEAVNVFVSWLAGHRCQLASDKPGTPLDQVVRSPFSSSTRKYSTYFFTLSGYFIELLLYPISCHAFPSVSLPGLLSLP